MTFPILPSNSQTGYFLTRSLRFRASASAYLNRTNTGTVTNNAVWTWSAWVKIGNWTSSNAAILFGNGAAGSANECSIKFTNNQLEIINYVSSLVQARRITTQVFRDPSAWYHIVVASNSSTALNIYVNGVQITSFATSNGPSAAAWALNTTSTVTNIGFVTGAAYFDGQQAEVNFIDGQALTPSSFGSTNSTTGVWQPARYVGTYGTNGFYLPFTDNSALTTSSNVGLGKDFSGNGNYWTTNNISITAGVTYDSMTDVPTLTSATAANFAVLNPLDYVPTNFTLSNANLTWTTTTSGNGSTLGSIAMTSGKYYWEVYANSVSSIGSCGVGVAKAGSTVFGANQILYVSNTGQKSLDGTLSAYGSTWFSPDLIGIAYDAAAGQITFYKNNVSQGVITLTGYAGVNVFPVVSDGSSLAFVLDANFGQRPFAYTPPSGFVALNTYNLPTSTILQGNKVMDATLYTGNGSTQTITNAAGFKPDLVWIKDRVRATSNILTDSVRGVNSQLFSDLTNAQETRVDRLTAFNSNGFSVGSYTDVNINAEAFVGWQWQAGQGSSSSNTSGTITSTVSVNASAGFSVVTYTGTGANATVGHGLGVAPSFIAVKQRSASGQSWQIYHSFLGQNYSLQFDTSNASSSYTNIWYNGVTSSVFGVNGTLPSINGSGSTYIAYCWSEIAGYSKFGSYAGNGSSDGTFVYLGFRPKYVMIKCSSAGSTQWAIFDTTRNPSNLANLTLYASLSVGEYTALDTIDILSNGFKVRNTNVNVNTSGATYVFAAFAESPFKNSLAR